MKLNIGIIFGGRTVEHEVSIISALQCIQYMNKDKYDITPLYIAKDGAWYTGEKLLHIENYKNMTKLLFQSKKIILSPNANEHILFKHAPYFFSKNISKFL